MELDDATRQDLAAFLARRYPTAEARATLAGSAGLSVHGVPPGAVDGWGVLIRRAEQTARLPKLLDAACAGAPDDANLAEVRRVLAEKRGPPVRLLVGGGAVAFIVLAGAFVATRDVDQGSPLPAEGGSVASQGGPEAAPPAPAQGAPTEPANTTTEPATAELAAEQAARPGSPALPDRREGEPAAAAPVVAAGPEPVGMAEPSAPVTTPAVAPPAPKQATAPPTKDAHGNTIPSQCRGSAGALVGYWYAGQRSPGAAGETISLPSSVNIRADYPHAENRYAMRGEVLCSVSAGTRQRLSSAPVDVGGGNYWVPVMGGDLGE